MVCNESKDIFSLISFLKKVKDPEDEINILVDSEHVTSQVLRVLEHFQDDIVRNERPFDGNFSAQRNYHLTKCSGDYIFIIDPDEMPQEFLIKNIKNVITETGSDLVFVPRMNLHPGYTQEWLNKFGFKVNEVGWVNWPDYQGRVFKRGLEYKNELHEQVTGSSKHVAVKPDPNMGLWHIKSVEKQNNRWDHENNFEYVLPKDKTNLYDSLM